MLINLSHKVVASGKISNNSINRQMNLKLNSSRHRNHGNRTTNEVVVVAEDNVISSLTITHMRRLNKEEVVTRRVPRNNSICRVTGSRRKTSRVTGNTTIIRSRMSPI